MNQEESENNEVDGMKKGVDSKGEVMHMLIYGLEVCPLTNSDLKALDFVVDRFFMKLFQTSNMEIIRLLQQIFNFVLPSELIEKRANKFLPGSCML